MRYLMERAEALRLKIEKSSGELHPDLERDRAEFLNEVNSRIDEAALHAEEAKRHAARISKRVDEMCVLRNFIVSYKYFQTKEKK
jgi:hypothetical protein